MKLAGKVKPKVPPMEPGTYIGLCVGIYDLGEQETTYKGRTRYQNKVLFTFEFPSKTVEIDGEQKPRQLSRTFAVSLSQRGKLRSFLRGWRGTDFKSDTEMANYELKNLLGRSALVQVVLNDTGEYANIEGVMQMPAEMPDPTTATKPLCFDMEEWDDDVFKALPDWIQEKIQNSTQYKERHAPDQVVDFLKETEEPDTTTGNVGNEVPF